MMSSQSEWTILATYEALYEAELAAGRLESAGILAGIDQRGGVGIFGPGHEGRSVRGVALLVPTVQLSEAREALDLEGPPSN